MPPNVSTPHAKLAVVSTQQSAAVALPLEGITASLVQAPIGQATKFFDPGKDGKLNLFLLIALVVGSIIGSGIFGLPQNMAASAGAGAIVLGWLITGVGMLLLARTYQMLSLRRPQLDNGVYVYARELSGEYVGFNSAWGYWISAWIGNVGYLVAAFSAMGYFFPAFGEGNTPMAILGASVILWVVHALVLRGIHGATVLNAVVTFAKVVPLVLFIGLVALAFKAETFTLNFWGDAKLGSVLDQVKSTMLVTVWVFIGIEGASVYSARARERADVGRATVMGFLICLVLLASVSLLSLGIFSQPQLAALKNPSMAPVLQSVVGTWGAVLIYLGLIVSVGGGFLAWTLLAAESLFTPAGDGVMPKWLSRKNSAEVPANALWLTNGMVQIALLLTLVWKASYLALISLSTAMILVPYLFSALYGASIAGRDWVKSKQTTEQKHCRVEVDTIAAAATKNTNSHVSDAPVAVAAALYCLWLLYAAGLKYLLLSALLYAPGAALYFVAKRELGKTAFSLRERIILLVLLALAALSLLLLFSGQLSL